jgi:hypothetical protein
VQLIVYADKVLIPDHAATPPSKGTSTPVKATCDERRPEQELRKSREELRVIHDNHVTNDASASMDECINENYNQQWEVTATGVTKPKDRVLRDKTNVAHHGTPPKKDKGAGKPKDTLATGTSDSPRARQDDRDLARIAYGPAPPGGRHPVHHGNDQSGRSTGWACNGRTQVRASRAVPRARTSLGRQRVILGRAARERSGGPGVRTRCALLVTRYAFGDYTIGSRGFIAAVTRTAGPRPFGGAGL